MGQRTVEPLSARRQQTLQPPAPRRRCLSSPKRIPVQVTYPRPPDFTGTALLEQLLIHRPARCAETAAGGENVRRRHRAAVGLSGPASSPLWRNGKIPAVACADGHHAGQRHAAPVADLNPMHEAGGGERPAVLKIATASAATTCSATSTLSPSRLTRLRQRAGGRVVANSCCRLRRSCVKPTWRYGRPQRAGSGKARRRAAKDVAGLMPKILRRCWLNRMRHGLTRWSRMAAPLRYALSLLCWA